MSQDTTGAPATLPCPSWCTVDHTEQDRKLAGQLDRVRERVDVPPDYVPDWMARWHTHTVASLINPENPHQPVNVGLFRDDSLVDPDANRVVVSVDHADTMHPETAAKVARAITEAVRIATA